MLSQLAELFDDPKTISKIQVKLPYLFQIAELDSSRAGKVGMEVGSVREKIITAFLIYKFGVTNIDNNIPITEAEVDVKVFGSPISIKTVTGKKANGVKLIWTVDPTKAKEFLNKYKPSCDMLFVQVNWEGGKGGFYYITKETQIKHFIKFGRKGYIKLPKAGTNPRGVEIANEALEALLTDKDTKAIPIVWKKQELNYNVYDRWVEFWEKD